MEKANASGRSLQQTAEASGPQPIRIKAVYQMEGVDPGFDKSIEVCFTI
jgi:hypothetical protein